MEPKNLYFSICL